MTASTRCTARSSKPAGNTTWENATSIVWWRWFERCSREARASRAQHGVDELREVLGPAEGIRLRLRIREHVQGHQLPASRHERGRREARVGVLRRGPYEQRLAAARPGTAARAAPVQLHH